MSASTMVWCQRLRLLAASVALLSVPRLASAQAPAELDSGIAARALVVVADSLCAATARAVGRGELAQVAFGGVLRPALTALAAARCPALTAPVVLTPGQMTSLYRLTDFQVEGDSVRVALTWEGGIPNGPGISWSTNAFRGTAARDARGVWVFRREPIASMIADGALRIVSVPTPRRRWWCHFTRQCP